MQMEDLSCTPKPTPLFSLLSNNQKNEWILNAAEKGFDRAENNWFPLMISWMTWGLWTVM
jgi:hypothetical protein